MKNITKTLELVVNEMQKYSVKKDVLSTYYTQWMDEQYTEAIDAIIDELETKDIESIEVSELYTTDVYTTDLMDWAKDHIDVVNEAIYEQGSVESIESLLRYAQDRAQCDIYTNTLSKIGNLREELEVDEEVEE